MAIYDRISDETGQNVLVPIRERVRYSPVRHGDCPDPVDNVTQSNVNAEEVRQRTWRNDTYHLLEVVWGPDVARKKLADRRQPSNYS